MNRNYLINKYFRRTDDNKFVEFVTYSYLKTCNLEEVLTKSNQYDDLNNDDETLKSNSYVTESFFKNVLVKNFKVNQDIKLIRDKKQTFTDFLFKTSDESIINLNNTRRSYDQASFYEAYKSVKSKIKWKRCKEISNLSHDGLSQRNEFVLNENGQALSKNFTLDEYLSIFAVHDIFQVGRLGDCFMLSIVMGLVKNKELLAHVVPVDNAKISSMNLGAYHFRFWSLGEWYDVVIDDFLPVYNNKLYFARNLTYSNEFWVPLFEKAMAKFFGSYENLNGGYPADSFALLSGGIHDSYFTTQIKLKCNRPFQTTYILNYEWHKFMVKSDTLTNYLPNIDEFFLIMKYAIKSLNIISCFFSSEPNSTKFGVYCHHVYNVAMVSKINDIQYVKIQNPHNQNDRIKSFDQNIKFVKILSMNGVNTKTHPGEFFMSYEDFIDCFENITVTNLFPEKEPLRLLNQQDKMKSKSNLFTQWKIDEFKGMLTNKQSQNKKLQVEIYLQKSLNILIVCSQSYKKEIPNVEMDILKIQNSNQLKVRSMRSYWCEMQSIFKVNLEPGKYVCNFNYVIQQQVEELFCMRIFYDMNE